MREDRKRRLEAITEVEGLDTELGVAAWEEFSRDCDLVAASGRLGVSTNYMLRLLGRRTIQALRRGDTYDEVADCLGVHEADCWNHALSELEEGDAMAATVFRASWLGKRFVVRLSCGSTLAELADNEGISVMDVRDTAALALAISGETLEAIGNRLGLSRERVRQILSARWRVSKRELAARRTSGFAAATSTMFDAAAAWVKAHPGCTLDEIASAIGFSRAVVSEWIPVELRHLILDAYQTRNTWSRSTWSRGETLKALRDAFELRNPMRAMMAHSDPIPLSGSYYEGLRKNGQIHGPSEARILQVFGSWTEACDEAGVPVLAAARVEYGRRWSDEELVGHVAAFLSVTESAAIDSFDLWCKEDEERPSSGTVRKQLRLSWADAKEAALLSLRSQWTDHH